MGAFREKRVVYFKPRGRNILRHSISANVAWLKSKPETLTKQNLFSCKSHSPAFRLAQRDFPLGNWRLGILDFGLMMPRSASSAFRLARLAC